MLESGWSVDRVEAVSNGGMVAAKTPQAACAGASVLAADGNAVDAAVVTALVVAVSEPWMNGLGGGGMLVRYDSRNDESSVVEFPMVSPASATPAMFPLAGTGPDAALFGWPAVKGDANVIGHQSVCVPGEVAGLAVALEKYGTWSWASALEPAIALASEGVPITWHTTMEIARDLGNLNKFAATQAIFCGESGAAPYTIDAENPLMMVQHDLADTLSRLALEGPSSFYEGEIATACIAHLNEGGANFTAKDFASYQPRVNEGIQVNYHGSRVLTTGGGTGGTTLAQSLHLLERSSVESLPHNSVTALHRMAQAFRLAFVDRFTYLADAEHCQVPLETLLSTDYLDERAELIREGQSQPVAAGDRRTLGITHDLPGSMPDYSSGGSTTHLSVIDKDGVAVSLTQTLLSLWGSRVTVPGTGILLNNGMMWFDPVPGRPNSVGGRKRPLSNMSPAIVIRDGQGVAALGASGGRKILNCVAQIAMNLVDHDMSMQAAVSAPRIDASTPSLFVSSRIDQQTIAELRTLGHRVIIKDETLFLGEFSSPACVDKNGTRYSGGVDPYYFPATAIGVNA